MQALYWGLIDSTASGPALRRPLADHSWPSVQDRKDAIEIIYVGGEGSASSDIPEDLVQAIKLDVGNMFENRESTIAGTIIGKVPDGYDSLTRDYKIHMID